LNSYEGEHLRNDGPQPGPLGFRLCHALAVCPWTVCWLFCVLIGKMGQDGFLQRRTEQGGAASGLQSWTPPEVGPQRTAGLGVSAGPTSVAGLRGRWSAEPAGPRSPSLGPLLAPSSGDGADSTGAATSSLRPQT
jgi:hypothetical protein